MQITWLKPVPSIVDDHFLSISQASMRFQFHFVGGQNRGTMFNSSVLLFSLERGMEEHRGCAGCSGVLLK